MLPRLRDIRSRTAAVVLAVLAATSLAVPLMDMGLVPGTLAVAEEGSPSGYAGHDHSICLQHGATAWSSAVGAELPTQLLVQEDVAPTEVVLCSGHSFRFPHQSRAPPII